MHGLIVMLSAAVVQVTSQQSVSEAWPMTQKHDDEVRARNAERDYFFVSAVRTGLSQIRFYIDRGTIRDADASGIKRAWVDGFEVIGHKKPISLTRYKILTEARCSESSPQTRLKVVVTYAPDGTANSEAMQAPWEDVIPETSMESQHRFICHSEPANAFYPVFNGNTPLKDAMAYFSQADR